MIPWISEPLTKFYRWLTDVFGSFHELVNDNMTLIVTIAFLAPLGVWLLCQIFRRLRSYVTLRNMLFVSVTVSAFIFCMPFYIDQFTVRIDDVSQTNLISAMLMSFQHALRLFALDGDFGDIVNFLLQEERSDAVAQYYAAFSSFLCLLAPLLTFTLLLSFIKNLNAKVFYTLHIFRSTHIFSELNEKSLAMAKSLAKHHKTQYNDAAYLRWVAFKKLCRSVKDRLAGRKTNAPHSADRDVPSYPPKPDRSARAYRVLSAIPSPIRFFTRPLIVFTDVLDKHEEEHYELISGARDLNAILFRKDLASIHFRFAASVWRRLTFYLISEDEPEKIRHATHIMSRYDYFNASLYVFSDNVECQLLLSPVGTKRLSVKRINDIQALIYHNLDRHGLRLFRNAQEVYRAKHRRGEQSERPQITAVVVGLGQYGMEMLRALYWYGQSFGSQFSLRIHAFDEREDAESKLHALCPDLKKPTATSTSDNRYEEDFYPIVHSGVAVDTDRFTDALRDIPDTTFVFVGLGTDELNIATAIRIRSLYARLGCDPDIETVVYDSNISKKMSVQWQSPHDADKAGSDHSLASLLRRLCKRTKLIREKEKHDPSGIKNQKGQAYNVHMIGDLENFYSAATLLHSELDEAGERCELRWTTAGLLNRYEERDILKKVIALTKDPERGFDPAASLIFFPKNQPLGGISTAHIASIETTFRGGSIDNVPQSGCALLQKYLHEKIRSTFKLAPNTELTVDDLRKFQKTLHAGEILYAREDPVSESVIYDSAMLATDPNSEPDHGNAKRGCRWLNSLCRRKGKNGEEKKTRSKTAPLETFAQKLDRVENDVKTYSEQIRRGESPGFRTIEYNYRSSITRAMRDRLRAEVLKHNSTSGVVLQPNGEWSDDDLDILIHAFPKQPQDRNLEEMKLIGKLEHPAWNAYMRTEGFTYGEKTNILAKQHECLVATSALSAKQLRKDA